MRNCTSIFIFINPLKQIIKRLQEQGAVSFLVGGCVRDLVLGRDIKDIDIEVHNLPIEGVQKCLESFGPVSLVGKQFGVLRIHGIDVDWSLPRRDSSGRKPTVTIDPYMTFVQAARRRDLTMNAMGINLNDLIVSDSGNYEIIDPYHGLEALQNKQLCAVDQELFLEDPLRFFRVMQFIGRFEMMPDQALQDLCTIMSLADSQVQTPIARERIEDEIKKLLLKSMRPSLGFRWIKDLGRLKELFPELYVLIGVKQRADYHPEGDVFEHSMQALDAAAQEMYVDDDEKLLILLGALCHDMGKAVTTDAELHAYGHDKEGVSLAQRFLKRFTHDQILTKSVSKLVLCHMRPLALVAQGAKMSAYKRLALQLAPEVTMRQLALLCLADARATNVESSVPLTFEPDEYKIFLEKAEQAFVLHKPEPAALQGRDLLDVMQPGPIMGELLRQAYEIQLEEGIIDPVVLKQRVLKKAS